MFKTLKQACYNIEKPFKKFQKKFIFFVAPRISSSLIFFRQNRALLNIFLNFSLGTPIVFECCLTVENCIPVLYLIYFVKSTCIFSFYDLKLYPIILILVNFTGIFYSCCWMKFCLHLEIQSLVLNIGCSFCTNFGRKHKWLYMIFLTQWGHTCEPPALVAWSENLYLGSWVLWRLDFYCQIAAMTSFIYVDSIVSAWIV